MDELIERSAAAVRAAETRLTAEECRELRLSSYGSHRPGSREILLSARAKLRAVEAGGGQ